MKTLLIILVAMMIFVGNVQGEEKEQQIEAITIWKQGLKETQQELKTAELMQAIRDRRKEIDNIKCHWEVGIYILSEGEKKLPIGWEIHDIILKTNYLLETHFLKVILKRKVCK